MYICIYRKREREREKVIQVAFFPTTAWHGSLHLYLLVPLVCRALCMAMSCPRRSLQ